MGSERLHGIDVSQFNGPIDWATVKASGQVDFAILRSSLGWCDGDPAPRMDKRFRENVAGCEANGIPYGIYHYSYCLKPENAAREAEYVLRVIEGTKPTFGVWYDIEDNAQIPLGREALTGIVKTFCEVLAAAGWEVGIYSYLAWLEQYLDMDALSGWPVWLAQIAPEPTYSRPFVMWQHSWYGRVAGITGAVDLDVTVGEWPEKKEESSLIAALEGVEKQIKQIKEDWTNGKLR